MNELADRLEARGHRLFIERQNEFKTESSTSGLVIHGRPDMIGVDPDGRATIYDVKTGRESDSHVAQVQLYMYLVPRAQDGRWSGTTFDGALVYPDGREKSIPAASVDKAFVTRTAEFMRKMMSDTPARRVPSVPECRFCEITSADCVGARRVEGRVVSRGLSRSKARSAWRRARRHPDRRKALRDRTWLLRVWIWNRTGAGGTGWIRWRYWLEMRPAAW